MDWRDSRVDTGRPVARILMSADEHGLRPIHAFLCPFVSLEVYCIDVQTGADLFLCCFI